jgi:hypothetical protein
VSKGSGLQFVADRLGFTRERTVAFGDGENDLELIDWAGYSVAVGNAHPVVKARADRGSPMFFDPESQSITQLRPAACYDFIFPTPRFNLERVSYYFDHHMENVVDDEQYDDILTRVADWQERWATSRLPFLRYRKSWSSVVIDDGRNGGMHRTTYADRPAALYEHCADARSPSDIASQFGRDAWVGEALRDFCEKDFMIFLDGHYLSLALPENPNL